MKKLTARDKKIAALAAGGALLLLCLTCAFTGGRVFGSATDLHLKCTIPDCGKVFSISREDMRDYPRGQHGEGFKCKRCGKFSAFIATRCPKCGNWYTQPTITATGAPCPKCYPGASAKPARPHGD